MAALCLWIVAGSPQLTAFNVARTTSLHRKAHLASAPRASSCLPEAVGRNISDSRRAITGGTAVAARWGQAANSRLFLRCCPVELQDGSASRQLKPPVGKTAELKVLRSEKQEKGQAENVQLIKEETLLDSSTCEKKDERT